MEILTPLIEKQLIGNFSCLNDDRLQKIVTLLQHSEKRQFDLDLEYEYVARLFDRAMQTIEDDERLHLTEKVPSWKHMFNK